MKTLKTLATAAVLATAATTASASSIVDIAAGDERFSTLVAAVEAAGLVDTLAGPGPFTVYAPINDAFAALPAGTGIPTASTHCQRIPASERAFIPASASGVSIADGTGEMANVVIADIVADNGVIHVVDKVLLPGTRPACH